MRCWAAPKVLQRRENRPAPEPFGPVAGIHASPRCHPAAFFPRLDDSIHRVLLPLLLLALLAAGCQRRHDQFVLALESTPQTLDPLQGTAASSERLRQLMFNSLMRKNEQLDYVGDLAARIERAPDNLSVKFTLREGVYFHDGRELTAADVKYTLETLLASTYAKAGSFYEGAGQTRQPFITGVTAPDARTIVIRLRKPWPSLFANLVPIAIIPQGSAAAQKDHPVGTGPFKFVRYDEAQQVVDMAAHEQYMDGAPPIKRLRVRTILDGNTLQAELLSGRVDLAPLATNLSPDAYRALSYEPRLQVRQAPGANVQYLAFNTKSPPLDDARLRRAIAYAINREQIVTALLQGQARIANSILPPESWAYAPGETYPYDPARAQQILDEAGYRDPDGDGPQMRLSQPLIFKISASNTTVQQYAGVIQNQLRRVGLPVEIETLEDNVLFDQLIKGQYQMSTARWVGGNQDPIFLKDLFASDSPPRFNRTRYSNPQLDPILHRAVDLFDREEARALYAEAQQIISRDVPMLPLWYPDNMVAAQRRVADIRIESHGDFSFVRHVRLLDEKAQVALAWPRASDMVNHEEREETRTRDDRR
jgi:peptide/nickel transport system substrate-binding protein